MVDNFQWFIHYLEGKMLKNKYRLRNGMLKLPFERKIKCLRRNEDAMKLFAGIKLLLKIRCFGLMQRLFVQFFLLYQLFYHLHFMIPVFAYKFC